MVVQDERSQYTQYFHDAKKVSDIIVSGRFQLESL